MQAHPHEVAVQAVESEENGECQEDEDPSNERYAYFDNNKPGPKPRNGASKASETASTPHDDSVNHLMFKVHEKKRWLVGPNIWWTISDC